MIRNMVFVFKKILKIKRKYTTKNIVLNKFIEIIKMQC